jgi:GTP cyclohydrolase I
MEREFLERGQTITAARYVQTLHKLRRALRDKHPGRYETTEAIQKAVRQCLRMAGTELYRRGVFKLPERWEKCVQRSGDYVEK